MQNAITTLRIQNFKSLKDVTMAPRRVNIIIGEPNVGKSNILEAMSLLGGMFFDKPKGKFMDGQIRYENLRNIFYDDNWNNKIEIRASERRISKIYQIREEIGIEFGKIHEHGSIEQLYYAMVDVAGKKYGFQLITKKEIGTIDGPIPDLENDFVTKKYTFVEQLEHGHSYAENYLRPPFGDNMLDVFQYSNNSLRREVASLFKPYGLHFAVRVADRKFEIQKNIDGYVYNYPYSLIADTLQRLIFYLAAIESNDDSVLLFEEPEAHSYPVYVSQLARRIVESRNNQFFVVTHSPYFITEVLEEMLTDDELKSELGIFVAYYEDYQTKVRQLSDEEVYNIRRDGLDVFYNMARFVPQAEE